MFSLTDKCAEQKLKNFRSSSLSCLMTCLHHMVILRSQNKITDFLMILAWDCPFNERTQSFTGLDISVHLFPICQHSVTEGYCLK